MNSPVISLKKIIALLSRQERRRITCLFGAILIMAFIDVVGVASILPFMAVLASPKLIEANPWLSWAYKVGGFASSHTFMIFLGVVVLCSILFSSAFTALTRRAMLRFTHMLNYSLSSRLLSDYVNRPYLFFVNRNSADLSKNILTEVQQCVTGVIFPAIDMLSKVVVSLFIITLLVVVEPMLAIIMVLLLGGVYVGLYSIIKNKLARDGRLRLEMNGKRYQVTAELFGGIKEALVLGRAQDFIQRYSQAARAYATTQADFQIISQLPRYALESLVFSGILLIILYYLVFRGGVELALPLMALYAMAAYRILPGMQYIFQSVTQIRFHLPAVDVLSKDIGVDVHEDCLNSKIEEELDFKRDIELRAVNFTYPDAKEPALKEVSLSISRNSAIAFVGSTGSGKTTLVDVILGLLEPEAGALLVDGKKLNPGCMCAWRRRIGYVPQQIFLADDSVERNIAYGIRQECLDRSAVERVAQIANIHEFVALLPRGYDTIIGERGVRLSGGQRQRIGIARALYHNPDILIMDEGTSALDGMTEEVVMKAIDDLAHEKTIILVAHRLTTVRQCDMIYLMENGRFVSSGKYDELMETNSQFRAMARVNAAKADVAVDAIKMERVRTL